MVHFECSFCVFSKLRRMECGTTNLRLSRSLPRSRKARAQRAQGAFPRSPPIPPQSCAKDPKGLSLPRARRAFRCSSQLTPNPMPMVQRTFRCQGPKGLFVAPAYSPQSHDKGPMGFSLHTTSKFPFAEVSKFLLRCRRSV